MTIARAKSCFRSQSYKPPHGAIVTIVSFDGPNGTPHVRVAKSNRKMRLKIQFCPSVGAQSASQPVYYNITLIAMNVEAYLSTQLAVASRALCTAAPSGTNTQRFIEEGSRRSARQKTQVATKL